MTHDDNLISQIPHCVRYTDAPASLCKEVTPKPKNKQKKNSKVLGEGTRKVGKLVISVVKMAQQ